jgi:hypothetical protein
MGFWSEFEDDNEHEDEDETAWRVQEGSARRGRRALRARRARSPDEDDAEWWEKRWEGCRRGKPEDEVLPHGHQEDETRGWETREEVPPGFRNRSF